jgi:hypothetical protein
MTNKPIDTTKCYLARAPFRSDSKQSHKWVTVHEYDYRKVINPLKLSRQVLVEWYEQTGQGYDYASVEPYSDCFHFGIGRGKGRSSYCEPGTRYLLFDKNTRVYNRLHNPILLCPEGNTDALALVSAGCDRHYGILKRENLQTVHNLDEIPDYTEQIIFLRDADENHEQLEEKLLNKGYKLLSDRGIGLYSVGSEQYDCKDISQCLRGGFDENYDENEKILQEILLSKMPLLGSKRKSLFNSVSQLLSVDNVAITSRLPSVIMTRIVSTFFEWQYNSVTLDIKIRLNKAEWDACTIPDKAKWAAKFGTDWVMLDKSYANAIDRFIKQIVEHEKGKSVILNDRAIDILTSPDSNNTIDPFADYFDSLEPINPNKGNNPIADALECIRFNPEAEQHRGKIVELFGKWMGMAVNCAKGMQYNEIMIILTGEQGAGKTTLFNSLVPEQLKNYVTDTLEEGKDGSLSLTDSFLAIDDELDGLKRNNLDRLKKRITSSSFKFRPLYATRNVSKIRRASFLGATNSDAFLVDSTGNRRFFCIPVVKHDDEATHNQNMKKLREYDPDQLWRVGKYYADRSDSIFFTPEDLKFINDNLNKQFEIENEWDQLVRTNLANPATYTEGDKLEFMTSTQILVALNKRSGLNLTNDRYSATNLGIALQKAGFKRKAKYDVYTKFTMKGYEVKLVNQVKA